MMINAENYVDRAENVIKTLLKNKNGRSIPIVTTSKLRNLLAMTADIRNEIMNQNEKKLNEGIRSKIEYLRIRFIYEAGREPSVKALVTEAGLLDILKEIGADRERFLLFNRYMEALVAYRKFYVEKDE